MIKSTSKEIDSIRSIYSLRELHDILEQHQEKHKLFVVYDIDLTIVLRNLYDDQDILIEPVITKQLFHYMLDQNIWFIFLTARFYDTVCNARKRNLDEMTENIRETLFPIFQELGLDVSHHDKDDSPEIIIKNDKGKCVGVEYRGILFGDKKGEIIKHYRKKYGITESHPHVIFVDDVDEYLKGAIKHVPGITVLKRYIK